MWTLIRAENYPSFIQRYPQLERYQEDLKLHQVGNLIFLPRHFHRNYPHPDLIKHVDKNFRARPLGLQFKGELKKEDKQDFIVAPFVRRILNGSGSCGVLKARPGAGKTVMSIYIACATQRKTLIVIDNTKLAEQWMESILKFTTATENDIGWIKGDDYNVDPPFVIAMVQTLVSRVKRDVREYYAKMTQAGLSLTFMDECHRSALGPQFAKASLLMNTPDIIGLSATPFVQGLHEIIMLNTIGPVLSDTKHYDMKPEINIVRYNSGLTEQYGRHVLMVGDMLKQRARYNKILVESPRYLDLIAQLNSEMRRENHRIINIVFTQEQVHRVSDHLAFHGIANRQFYSKKRDVDKETDNVLVATYSYAGAGFDFKALSGCIIATPLSGRKSLIQVVGRVLRAMEGKEKPKVYILIDTGFAGTFVREIPRIINILQTEFDGIVNEIDM